MAGNSRTSRYYRKNPKAAAKRKAYDRKYSKKNYGSEAPDSAAKRKRNKTAAERAKWRKKNGMVNTAKGRGKTPPIQSQGVWLPNPRVGTVPGTENQAAPQRSDTLINEPMDSPRSLMHDLLTFRASDAKRMWRENILARDGYTCTYCGSTENLTLDHIVPRCRGGARWDASNVTTACRQCNQRKGSMLLHEFQQLSYGLPTG